jgi:hypothetical protein
VDLSNLLQGLTLDSSPALPDPLLAAASLRVLWALLLACGTLALLRQLPQRWRWSLAAAVGAWTIWPGPESPAYWLGLAFQSPSLMSGGLCLWWLWREQRGGLAYHPTRSGMPGLTLAAIALGWVLGLDTWGLFSFSVYAWGFGPFSIACVALAAVVLWAMGGASKHPQAGGTLLLGLVLVTYAALRLPTGNLWDALLDPWLWLVLQLGLIRSLVRRAACATARIK